jgi:hypothetical protein
VIINATDFFCVASGKPEHDAILLIHPEAVKTGKVAFELLQSVRRRHSQVFHRGAGIQDVKLSLYPVPEFTGSRRAALLSLPW